MPMIRWQSAVVGAAPALLTNACGTLRPDTTGRAAAPAAAMSDAVTTSAATTATTGRFMVPPVFEGTPAATLWRFVQAMPTGVSAAGPGRRPAAVRGRV